jgi:hypothetical protein
MTTATYTTTSIVMLTLNKSGHIEVTPWPDEMPDHSDDEYELADWLRQGKEPTCSNDVAIIDMVQAIIDEG